MTAIPKLKLWLDGRIVEWDEAQMHVVAHTLHYGLGAFEGIRAYRCADGRVAIFRLRDHIERLFDSCRICRIEVPFSPTEIMDACVESVRVNDLGDAYLRPLVFLGEGTLAIASVDNPVQVAVIPRVWKGYFTGDAAERGLRVNVSSFTRGGLNASMSKGKICGQYVNSVLAKRESLAAGFDECILLDGHGHVAEGSAENVFVVRRGRLVTPPLSAAVLAGITRDTVLVLAAELGIDVEERNLTRDELYLAEEVFLTGTAGELTAVREVDGRRIGTAGRGPLTHRLTDAFFRAARGQLPAHQSWLTMIR